MLTSNNSSKPNTYWDLIYRYSSLKMLLRVTFYSVRLILKISQSLKSKGRLIEIKVAKLSIFTDALYYDTIKLSVKELNHSKFLWVYIFRKSIYF